MKRIIFITNLMLFIFLLSCNSSPVNLIKLGEPPILEGDLIFGEFYVQLEPHISLSEFLKLYSNFKVKVEEKPFRGYIMSFDYNLIDGNELVKLIESRGDGWAELGPGWVKGELIFALPLDLSGDEVNQIINYYKNKGLELLSHSSSLRYFRVSFDYKRLNEFTIRNYLRNDSRLLWADFNGPDRFWTSGVIMLILFNDDFESFLSSYFEYDFNVNSEWNEIKYLALGFDDEQYDEFYIIDMFKNDPRVESASFSYHLQLGEGGQ
ncbi:MAG: hypothetical protein FWG98_14810 [Candidatus Cloacimonetes bacterium]|nr:hypothetical protein [Candidatus Cloacimonadota bacterium]